MIFTSLKGKDINIKTPHRYVVKWDGESKSFFQKMVKSILKEYWSADRVYEEFPMAGSRLTFDFFNETKMIVIEADGIQHEQYCEFFHKKRGEFLSSIKRDDKKEIFCELNKIKLIRVCQKKIEKLRLIIASQI